MKIEYALHDIESNDKSIKKEIELAKQYDIELAYQPFGQKHPVEANITGASGNEDEE